MLGQSKTISRLKLTQPARSLTFSGSMPSRCAKYNGASQPLQPMAGTNDKAGSMINLLRWVTPRVIKENILPPEEYPYPFMQEK